MPSSFVLKFLVFYGFLPSFSWGAEIEAFPPKADAPWAQKLEKVLHRTIKKVTEDIEAMKFNTAIAAMMSFLNDLERLGGKISQDDFEKFLSVLSPLAPHLAEEIWHMLGHKQSIFCESWPRWQEEFIKDDEVEIVVQINGKLRDRLRLTVNVKEDEIKQAAMNSETIKKWLANKKIKQIILVKGKLINIVVAE